MYSETRNRLVMTSSIRDVACEILKVVNEKPVMK